MTNQNEFQTEQFYLPRKFVPPFGIGDRYVFPDNRIWKISDVDIEHLGDEEVKITIHWMRPLYGDSQHGWMGKHRKGDTNWVWPATALQVWRSDDEGDPTDRERTKGLLRRTCPDCQEKMTRCQYQTPDGDWIVCWLCECGPDPDFVEWVEGKD